jgi:tRNA A-37 threonylcarbamoyl transferase component Bud32
MQAGDHVGPFDIEKRIGSGAMGAVYRALYRKTGQRVAIKVMATGLDGNATALARFNREAAVLKQFNHPNIVRFYVASQYQGSPYYAMEFIEGDPMDKILQRRGRHTWEEVVELGKQICAALNHAHQQGIVHRDLKPSNLMLMQDGVLKLTDFGIAKDLDVTQLTSANCTVGTVAYMSPEQCKGERNLTHKSDLYSLGVLFYEMLTGEKPFKAETTMDMFLQHVQGTFERPSRKVFEIPIWLDNLVCQLLEKKPEHRPLDAGVVAKALDQVAEKVATFRSAGVDVAKTRLLDPAARREFRLNQKDRQVARTILSGMKGGRRKKATKPFYERAWFQALGLLGLLAGVGTILYIAFRPPSAEILFQRAQSLVKSDNLLEARKAIKDYLRSYGGEDNAQTAQIRRWADEIDTEQAWRSLKVRMKLGFEPDGEGERTARDALKDEEEGNLEAARDYWQAIREPEEGDDTKRGWWLLAKKRAKDIQEAMKEETTLGNRIKGAVDTDRVYKPEDPNELQAAEALMLETHFEDYAAAHDRWVKLKPKTDESGMPDKLALLATQKIKELKEKRPKDNDEIRKTRMNIVQSQLAEAQRLLREKPNVAVAICEEVIQLYKVDPELAKLVGRAKDLMNEAKPIGRR